MGVFGDFNVSITDNIKSQDPIMQKNNNLLSVPDHINYSQTVSQMGHHNHQTIFNNKSNFLSQKIVDRGSMISI